MAATGSLNELLKRVSATDTRSVPQIRRHEAAATQPQSRILQKTAGTTGKDGHPAAERRTEMKLWLMKHAIEVASVALVALTWTGVMVVRAQDNEPEPATEAAGETAQIDDIELPPPIPPNPIMWLHWPSGECLHVSRAGSCEEPPPLVEIGWAAPQFDGPPWFADGRPLGPFDIEFEPLRAQRMDADGYAGW